MPPVLAFFAGLTALIVFIAVVLANRKTLFWLAFIAPFVPLAYIDRYYVDLPASLKWAPFLVVALAALARLVLMPKDTPTRTPTSLILAYSAILIVSAVSLFVNDSAPASFLVAQRGYVILFCSIVAVLSAVGIYDKDELFAGLVWLGLISCGICILQRVFIVPGIAGPHAGDRVTGLFSVGYITLFFHLSCIGITVAYWLQGKRVVSLAPLATVLILVLGIAVANQKAALPFLVVLLAFAVLRSGNARVKRNAWKLALAAVAMPILLLGVFTTIYDAAYQRGDTSSYSRVLTEPAYLERYLFGEGKDQFTPAGRLLRGSAVLFASQLIAEDPARLAFGLGPGETSESRVPGASGQLTRKYPGYAIDRVSLSMILAETGVLGLLAQLTFLLAVLRWKPLSLGHPEPAEHRLIREFFSVLAILYMVYGNMYYEPIFALLIATLIYPPAATATALARPRRVAPQRRSPIAGWSGRPA